MVGFYRGISLLQVVAEKEETEKLQIDKKEKLHTCFCECSCLKIVQYAVNKRLMCYGKTLFFFLFFLIECLLLTCNSDVCNMARQMYC